MVMAVTLPAAAGDYYVGVSGVETQELSFVSSKQLDSLRPFVRPNIADNQIASTRNTNLIFKDKSDLFAAPAETRTG